MARSVHSAFPELLAMYQCRREPGCTTLLQLHNVIVLLAEKTPDFFQHILDYFASLDDLSQISKLTRCLIAKMQVYGSFVNYSIPFLTFFVMLIDRLERRKTAVGDQKTSLNPLIKIGCAIFEQCNVEDLTRQIVYRDCLREPCTRMLSRIVNMPSPDHDIYIERLSCLLCAFYC